MYCLYFDGDYDKDWYHCSCKLRNLRYYMQPHDNILRADRGKYRGKPLQEIREDFDYDMSDYDAVLVKTEEIFFGA